MTANMLLLLCFLIGCVTGLRSMTGIALVCWGAHLQWVHLAGTKLSFLAHPASLIVFSLLAVGELVADKLPVPPRVQPGPLVVRLVFAALAAAALAMAAAQGWFVPAVLGGVGALVAAYAGYGIRKNLVVRLGIKDWLIAPVEDLVAIGLGLFVVSRF